MEPNVNRNDNVQLHTNSSNAQRFDQNGLILPKKLLNPSLESKEKKEIHREMLWKMKHGINAPKRDNEYKKAYQQYQQRLRNKEKETETMAFEKMLEEQKQRLHSVGPNLDQQQSTMAISEQSNTSMTDSFNQTCTYDDNNSNEFHRILTKLHSSQQSSNNNINYSNINDKNNNNQ